VLHIGIDLGGLESTLCVRDATGAIVDEATAPTHALTEALAAYPNSRVIVETCAESFAVAERLKAAGHDVRVVAASLVRQLGVGARGIKTDRRDARVLSEVSVKIELPSVHIPKAVSRDIRSNASLRAALVRSRTLLINTVRGYLRTRLVLLPRGTKTTFANRVRTALLERPEGMPAAIERQLVVIEELTRQVKAADVEIATLAEGSEVARLLMTAPGVGPLTALYFMTVVDEVGRFSSAQQLESYIGLTPGENSSSQKKSRTSITKAGPGELRRVLVQASWAACMHRPNDPLVRWSKQVAARRGQKIAIVALSRKLSGILFAMWRDKKVYDSKQVATSLAA
jgi:transposase